MKPILILKTGSTFSAMAHEFGDFEDWIIAATGEAPEIFVIADGVDEAIPPLEQLAGVIITGSHLMVSDGGSQVEFWAQLMRDAVALRLPVLGICYGHQLLAQALGGLVADHPGGLELGQVEIEVTVAAQDDPLFSALPRTFSAYATHLQSIQALPPGASVCGGNQFEPHHAVRFSPSTWGVQFHPEFNQQVMRAYIGYQRPRLKSETEMNALLEKVEPLPEVGQLLQRFCQLVAR